MRIGVEPKANMAALKKVAWSTDNGKRTHRP
jgi:hypothetical protein